MSPRQGKVDLDATRAQLELAGLGHAAARLPELVETAAKDSISAHGFLDRLLSAELGEREERRIKTSLRLSGLPTGQTLGNFDFSFQPSMEKSRIETLATCAWIREHATTLIAGPPGTGKTHIAVALGVKAIENGFSVAFYRLDDLLHAMKRDAELAPPAAAAQEVQQRVDADHRRGRISAPVSTRSESLLSPGELPLSTRGDSDHDQPVMRCTA